VTGYLALLDLARGVFGAPSFAIFTDLLTGWVCAPGRRTITGMIAVADPAGRRAHDAYHRFVRDGAWSVHRLWQSLACHLVNRFCPTGVVELACDDTLFHHDGRKVAGAGVFRDAVRSTIGRVVYARGLNLIVITLTIHPPWGGCPIAVPVNVRLHKKHDPTSTVAHAAEMMRQIADWLPGRCFHLVADGAYATLAGAGLPRTHLTSRIPATPPSTSPRHPAPGDAGGPGRRGTGCPPHPSWPPKPGNGTGSKSPSMCVAGPSSDWSTSVTCSGTGSTSTTWSAWSSSATRTRSNPTTSSSPSTRPGRGALATARRNVQVRGVSTIEGSGHELACTVDPVDCDVGVPIGPQLRRWVCVLVR